MGIRDLVEDLEKKLGAGSDINYITVKEVSNTITTVLSLILGLLASIIALLLPLMISLEIVYLCFPLARNAVEEATLRLESRGVPRDVIGFIFRDAREAVRRASTVNVENRSSLWIYLKIKLPTVFFVYLIIAFVLRGSTLVSFIQDLFRGVLDMIMSIL